MDNPNQLLADLVKALDEAFICDMQSTAAWDTQLDIAREYIERIEGGAK